MHENRRIVYENRRIEKEGEEKNRTEQDEHCLKSLQITFDFVIGVIVITNLVYLTKCRKKNANEPHGVLPSDARGRLVPRAFVWRRHVHG